MDGDRQLERLYERVTLVGSLGSRRRGELCVMSFVALLAGEGHTDQPLSASPLIRGLAIPINDALSDAERQRLKPFAPRILGTNDRCDNVRVEVLREAISGRILPQVRRDRSTGQVAGRGPVTWCLFGPVFQRDLEADTERLIAQIERGVAPSRQALLGSVVGELLSWCMREAATPEQRAWYRNEALMLLDHLCGVGGEARCPMIEDSRIAWAAERLANPEPSGIRRLLPMIAMARGRFLPGRTLPVEAATQSASRRTQHGTAGGA